ncbi:MAG: response regulator [Pseudomonadales bacterium]|nr:response regulator [Pseudomonadales bacterium]
MAIIYRDKSALIIDDFSEFRSGVRRMLEHYGMTDIQVAGTADDGVAKAKKRPFDIYICDYNLGDGKDGQQILEELRHFGIVKHTSVFIMVTAENTQGMVLGALEYQPDCYLTKPLTKAVLKTRLDRMYNLKEAIWEVNNAMDEGNYKAAIKYCDENIGDKSKYMGFCIKTKANLLYKIGQFEASRDLYDMLLEGRKVDWAVLGKAKSLFELEDYDGAIILFKDLIRENEMNLVAHDWLSRCYEMKNEPTEAQKTLELAVKKSPKAIKRQMKLGKLAKKNNDLDTATKAFRKTVRLGEHSVYRSSDNELNLAKALTEKAESDTTLAGKKAGQEALITLEAAEKKYRRDEKVQMQTRLVAARVFVSQERESSAEQQLREAKELKDKFVGDMDSSVVVEMAKTYRSMGNLDEAASLLNEVSHADANDELKADIEALVNDPEIMERQAELNENNQLGVELYQQKETDKAIDAFLLASEQTPTSAAINLNLAQALVKRMQRDGKTKQDYEKCMICLDHLKTLDGENKRYKRYLEICKIAASLKE